MVRRAAPPQSQVFPRGVQSVLRINVEGFDDEDEWYLRRNKGMPQAAIRLRSQDLLDIPREGITWLERFPQPCQEKSTACRPHARQAEANRTMHASRGVF